MAKKKRKDENKLLDENRWCVKIRKGWIPGGHWDWNESHVRYYRWNAVDDFCKDMGLNKEEWRYYYKKGVVACVKVKLVEQP